MNEKVALLEQLRIDRSAPSDPAFGLRRLRRLVGLGVSVAVVIGIALLWRSRQGVPVHVAIAQDAPAAPTATHAAGSILDASGYVVALREATVSGKGIYQVRDVLVQEGQAVKQGEVMARLDDSNVHAALVQAQAQVKQMQAALTAASVADEDARPIFLRSEQQLGDGLISQDTFDAAKATYDAVHAAVSVARQNLLVAQANVDVNLRYEDDTVIRAPFDGVVTVKTAQPGEIVSPQFSGGGGIAKIVDMKSLEVDVDVSEAYINRVQPHQPAQIILNAYPDSQMPAEVIAVIPTADRSKATVKVRIGFKEKDPRIVPDMGARVSFLDNAPQTSSNVLRSSSGVVVPVTAVQATGETGTVFLIKDEHLQRQTVKLGPQSGNNQNILSGLQPGAMVADGDLEKLSDQLRIRVVR